MDTAENEEIVIYDDPTQSFMSPFFLRPTLESLPPIPLDRQSRRFHPDVILLPNSMI
jgi:hypothetical protein